MQLDDSAALVVLSGGQDSTTCLAWTRNRFPRVEAIVFDYGQRHRTELDCAARIAALAGVALKQLSVSSLPELGGNALTSDEAVADGVRARDGLPNTFVPGRNLLFMTLAAAWAYQRDIRHLVTGVCQTDYSGYPDCRQSTMEALQAALIAGMDAPFVIHTPLMFLTKAQSIRLAQNEGALPLLAYSHTCYNGTVPPCGLCPACILRAKGFAEAGIADPLLERLAVR